MFICILTWECIHPEKKKEDYFLFVCSFDKQGQPASVKSKFIFLQLCAWVHNMWCHISQSRALVWQSGTRVCSAVWSETCVATGKTFAVTVNLSFLLSRLSVIIKQALKHNTWRSAYLLWFHVFFLCDPLLVQHCTTTIIKWLQALNIKYCWCVLSLNL